MISYLIKKLQSVLPENYQKDILRYYFYTLVPKSILVNLDIPIAGYFKKNKLKNGDVVIDCGAYKGHFAILAKRFIGREGLVIAFEPDKKNYELLLDMVKRNKIKNIKLYNAGLWNENGFKQFSNEGEPHAHIVTGECINGMENTNFVKVVKLDSIVEGENIKKIDFIKMDIEGAEVEALEGAEDTLKKMIPDLAIASYHVRNKRKTCDIITPKLEKLGYAVKTDFATHMTTYATKEK